MFPIYFAGSIAFLVGFFTLYEDGESCCQPVFSFPHLIFQHLTSQSLSDSLLDPLKAHLSLK